MIVRVIFKKNTHWNIFLFPLKPQIWGLVLSPPRNDKHYSLWGLAMPCPLLDLIESLGADKGEFPSIITWNLAP